MPRKNNHGQRIIAGSRKIKQVWRPKPPPTTSPPWTELPDDVTANILHRLGTVEILETAQKVCQTWRRVCKDPAMWRVIDMNNAFDKSRVWKNSATWRVIDDGDIDLGKMCRHAVDRSQGQIVDVNLEHMVVCDELLEYIADASCGNLRRLRIASCYGRVCWRSLIHALTRLPKLEELHIVHFFMSKKIVEAIGSLCPLLKSFTLSIRSFDIKGRDRHAKAIAKSMPSLRHLQFLRSCMTNEGLEAILKGCPHLESLDLRGCGNIELTGEVWKRCSTQIKYLRYPQERYEFDYDSDGGYDTEIYDDYNSDFD